MEVVEGEQFVSLASGFVEVVGRRCRRSFFELDDSVLLVDDEADN